MQPHVRLVTDKLAEVTPDGIVFVNDRGQRESVPADVIIWATGFAVGSVGATKMHRTDDPSLPPLTGTDLVDSSAVQSYLGICSPAQKNCFMMLGQRTGLGHNSIVLLIESMADFIAHAISEMIDRKFAQATIKPGVVKRFNMELDEAMRESVWVRGSGGVAKSWYTSADGVVRTLWPFSTLRYFDMAVPPADVADIFDVVPEKQTAARM